MNLKYMKVSLFEINNELFHDIQFFNFRCTCIYKVHEPLSNQNFKDNLICNDMIPLKY